MLQQGQELPLIFVLHFQFKCDQGVLHDLTEVFLFRCGKRNVIHGPYAWFGARAKRAPFRQVRRLHDVAGEQDNLPPMAEDATATLACEK
jgi:hypothetical protein